MLDPRTFRPEAREPAWCWPGWHTHPSAFGGLHWSLPGSQVPLGDLWHWQVPAPCPPGVRSGGLGDTGLGKQSETPAHKALRVTSDPITTGLAFQQGAGQPGLERGEEGGSLWGHPPVL